MKKVKFDTLCEVRHGDETEIIAYEHSDGYLMTVCGRECAIARKDGWGAWTATDIASGLAYPVDEYFEKRKDLIEWMQYKEDDFAKLFKKKKWKDRCDWAEKKLQELKESRA